MPATKGGQNCMAVHAATPSHLISAELLQTNRRKEPRRLAFRFRRRDFMLAMRRFHDGYDTWITFPFIGFCIGTVERLNGPPTVNRTLRVASGRFAEAWGGVCLI